MGYVLFSPIGNTDPIRGFHDGAWLHICRHYKPHTCVIYLSADMCRREGVVEADGRRKDLYARTLRLLNEKLFGEDESRYIRLDRVRDEQCEAAHSLEYFVPRFQELLNRMHRDYPDDEILINVSSGTPGMKGTLMALGTLLPFKAQLLQVSDYKMDQNTKNRIVDDTYDVEIEWMCNKDNEPDAKNRTSLQPLINIASAMRINELCRLVREGDYHTALQEAQSDSLKAHIPSKALLAIQGAERRSCMKLKDCGSFLERSGFRFGKEISQHADEKIWQCAEYLHTMRNDLRSGAFDNFMRKLTPELVNLCELYLAKLGKDVHSNGADRNGRWRRANMPDEWKTIVDSFLPSPLNEGSPLYTVHMIPLIRQFGSSRAADLAQMLRDAEEKVRNMVAHDIVPFGRMEIEKALQSTSQVEIRTPEAVADRLQELLEIIKPFYPEYWKSYDEMNEHICVLLKEP